MGGDIDLPANVLRLVRRALPAMTHVEVLLLLHRTAPRAWSVGDASAEVKAERLAVAAALAHLLEQHLVREEEPGQWRVDDRDATVMADVAALREAYDRRPVMLVRALYERPDPIQAFSNAFRLRRED